MTNINTNYLDQLLQAQINASNTLIAVSVIALVVGILAGYMVAKIQRNS